MISFFENDGMKDDAKSAMLMQVCIFYALWALLIGREAFRACERNFRSKAIFKWKKLVSKSF